MAFNESDYVDETFLEEIQCDKCPYSFPLYLFAEHELMVHALDNSDDSLSDNDDKLNDVQKIVDDAKASPVAQAEDPVLQIFKEKVSTPDKEKRMENLVDLNLVNIAKFFSTLEMKQEKEDQNVFENEADDDVQVIEEIINVEDEPMALSSFSSKAKKRIKEEKPSSKASSNILLKGLYSKPQIRNDLTNSDNEDEESLEDFWKRADIKIAQRKRKMEEIKAGHMY